RQVVAQFGDRLWQADRGLALCGNPVERGRRADEQIQHAGAERQYQGDGQAEHEHAATVAGTASLAYQRQQQRGQGQRHHQRGHRDKSDLHQSSPLSADSPTVVVSTPSRLRLRSATSTTPPPPSRISSGPNQSRTVPAFSGGLYRM